LSQQAPAGLSTRERPLSKGRGDAGGWAGRKGEGRGGDRALQSRGGGRKGKSLAHRALYFLGRNSPGTY
jgi:hypothetical protein